MSERKRVITEEMEVHKSWYQQAENVTIDELPKFLNHLVNDYVHDYGTICHALAASAIAAATAINKTSQGGISGFQAGAVMWEFIRHWYYPNNKVGLGIIDYDKLLYPQHSEYFDKTLPKNIWKRLQKVAKEQLEEADSAYAKYLEDMKQYEKDLAAFKEKHPDYDERPEYYEHLIGGTAAEWDEYEKRKEEGFEFAPLKPWVSVTPDSPVYKHWQSIVNGVVPFGFRLED